MKILASPRNPAEAAQLLAAGVDVVDVKNPDEGSLGAAPPHVALTIRRLANEYGTPMSIALGDLAHQPGTAALASFGAASIGADFVKAGLLGSKRRDLAASLMTEVCTAARAVRPSVQVVACGYADYKAFDGLPPDLLLDAAIAARCDYVMLDTFAKDGRSLLQCLTLPTLETFVRDAHRQAIKVALAGSLGIEDLPQLHRLQPDMIGVRGAVCSEQNRQSPVSRDKASAFFATVRSFNCTQA